MGEAHHHHRRHQQAAGTTSSSRMAMRGEIVEVQGGHIVRSTGRKDRHSKVCTAKGPRDRRVRLSAHTAIQFYDVQDRLGYDRPSKAVDWLIKKAKAAIDELVQLPAWDPDTLNPNAPHQQQEQNQQMNDENSNHNDKESDSLIGAHRPLIDAVAFGTRGSGRIMEQLGENSNGSGSGFFPASLDTNIADTIKCFFPMGATAPETNNSSIQFQNYPQDLLSRTSSSSHNQDLRLSLQSLEDPILLHHAQTHHNQHQHNHHHQQNEHLYSETTSLGFDGASYVEEHSQFNRMVAWPADAADTGNGDHDGGGGGGRGFIFNSPSPMMTPLPPLFGHSQYLSQRGPLQSSNSPSVRAWMDPSIAATTDHYHHYLPPTFLHQSAISGDTRFASSGLSGFCIPARIQGEEEHDGVSDKPSSTASDCRH